MNTIWSKYIQGIKTLYLSRKLRFDDMFSQEYKRFFNFEEKRTIKILEIGCGPGALASALHRWYPNAEITAVDRDTDFINFAKEHESGVSFVECDATELPFPNDTFDVTISNTVSEHIEPSKFYTEQYRVLKHGGSCIVLTSRKGINIEPNSFVYDEFEKAFWEKIQKHDDSMQKYSICKYPMNESELPMTMQSYGFDAVSTAYTTVDLTPDDSKYPPEMAKDMINSNRYGAIEAIESVLNTLPEHTSEEEINKMLEIANRRFDSRIEDYDAGKKHWDTDVSVIMMIKGQKP